MTNVLKLIVCYPLLFDDLLDLEQTVVDALMSLAMYRTWPIDSVNLTFIKYKIYILGVFEKKQFGGGGWILWRHHILT